MAKPGLADSYERGALLGYLRRAPIFSRCTDAQLDEVVASGGWSQWQSGDELVRQGDAGDDFFVVMSGSASVVRDDREVASLGVGDYFGELALFDPAPRNATVRANDLVTTLVIGRDAFQDLLGRSDAIRDEVLRGMAHRIHELDARV